MACVDIASHCDKFPIEDECTRSIEQRIARGGNGASSACVVALLKGSVSWCGSLGRRGDAMTDVVLESFQRCGVQPSHCVCQDAPQPVASIIVNRSKATRTVILNNQLPELSEHQLTSLPWTAYKWVHIEIRPSFEALAPAIRHARGALDASTGTATLSIELEKPRARDLVLAKFADVVFCSREFAECCFRDVAGSATCNASQFLLWMVEKDHVRPGTLVICAWGADGAWARLGESEHHAAACPPLHGVIDPVGAGDTFNGAVIRALSTGVEWASALEFGCRVAGFKIGVHGFEDIATHADEFLKWLQ
mmetsp:Transcript_52164/g.118704  ORF Transcript_52164/g.118704 Transcript_52164/m.118704 type:complete len:308 (+) Transcript_52164:3-926(+)